MERELEFFEKIYFSSQKIYRVRFSNKALILIKMLKNSFKFEKWKQEKRREEHVEKA